MNTKEGPNFFLIGASKTATTSIWDVLNSHPDVFMCTPKEPSFWISNINKERKENYLDLFKNAKSESIKGDASTIYSETTFFEHTPKNIFEFNPESKIIYVARNPIERLPSVWKQTLSTGHWFRDIYLERYGKEGIGRMSTDFEEAVLNYPPYIEAEKYWTHLSNYRKYFSDKNILVLFYEDLIEDEINFYRKITDFLNISPVDVKTISHKNKGSEKKRWPFWFKKLPGSVLNKVLQLLPPKLSHRYIKKPLETVVVSEKLKVKVLNQLKSEIDELLDYAGKKKDFWEL